MKAFPLTSSLLASCSLAGCSLLPVPDGWRKDPSLPPPSVSPTPEPTVEPTATPTQAPTVPPTPTPVPVHFVVPAKVCAGDPFPVELKGKPYQYNVALIADGKWRLGTFGKSPQGGFALYSVVLRSAGKRELSVTVDDVTWSASVLVEAC